MKKLTHTPGQWQRAISHDNASYTIFSRHPVTGNVQHIAHVFAKGLDDPREIETNARLIQAAPELLAALRIAAECMRGWLGSGSLETIDAYETAMRALRKVEL